MPNTAGTKLGLWEIIIRTPGTRNEMLAEALQSLAIQPYENKRVHIVLHSIDKNKIDNLENLANDFRGMLDIQTHHVSNENYVGYMINTAFTHCKGEYISFLDDDDVLYPSFSTNILNEIHTNKDVNFVYGDCVLAHAEKKKGYYKIINKSIFAQSPWNPLYLITGNYIPIHTYAFRRSDFINIKFTESIRYVEDWDFLLRLLFSKNLKVKYKPGVVCEYRRRLDGSNTTGSHILEAEKIKSNQMVINSFIEKDLTIKTKDVFRILPDHNKLLTESLLDPSLFSKLSSYFKGEPLTQYRNTENDQLVAIYNHKTRSIPWLILRICKLIVYKFINLEHIHPKFKL